MVSDPIDGGRHDTYCLNESGVLAGEPDNWMGDKGYVGNDMLTPIKKPVHRELLDWEKEFIKQINKVRYVIERVVANFKMWRIMHTDYRRPLGTFRQTISTVIALHFYKLARITSRLRKRPPITYARYCLCAKSMDAGCAKAVKAGCDFVGSRNREVAQVVASYLVWTRTS